jgi:membrane-associated HD superfamily phosphohydrolase
MKKEDFIKLGFSEEDAKKAADASQEELKAYIPKTRFDEVNNEKKKLELDVRERDTQLETLKNSTGDVEAMKKQITDLQADNKTKDDAHAAEIKQLKIDAAVTSALTASKAKNEKAVKALLELDSEKVELLEDGTIKGLDDQIKGLVESDDTKFLFNTETKKTQFKGATPGETGNESGDKGIDIAKMSYEELASYLEANPDAEI